ncbi:MAG TPA: NUDIX domain-containing protein [Catenuloplanes sp.]|jgi:8-oxo-dGTP pyrophosphatase MutT (NUDIX family)
MPSASEATSSLPATRRHRRIIDVHLLLLDGDRCLLSLRRNTGYADGLWHVPSGHLEADEHAAAGAAREAAEELAVTVDVADLTLAHLIDHRGAATDPPRLGIFYTATRWTGTPVNAEPDKCGGVAWFPVSDPPADTVGYHAAALAHINAGRAHSAYGWPPDGGPGPAPAPRSPSERSPGERRGG